jgi:pimeloyl-ACP methyl ester carboxylesterase
MLMVGGMPADYAAIATSHIDAVMRDAILELYRSAVDIGARWEPAMEHVRCPTLAIWPADDPYVDIRFGERLAARTDGRLLRLTGGHWWPVTRPAEVAQALTDFWRR